MIILGEKPLRFEHLSLLLRMTHIVTMWYQMHVYIIFWGWGSIRASAIILAQSNILVSCICGWFLTSKLGDLIVPVSGVKFFFCSGCCLTSNLGDLIVPVSKSIWQQMLPEALREIFFEVCSQNDDSILHAPGSAGLSVLLSSAGYTAETADFEKVMAREGWSEDHSFDFDDFCKLYHEVAWSSLSFGHLVHSIQDRNQRSEFPLLLPEESAETEEAQDLLFAVDKVEHVRIQSFIDYHKQKHLESLPLGAGTDIAKAEAAWLRDSYYPVLRMFFVNRFLEEGVCSHKFNEEQFVPMVAASSSEEKAVLQQMRRTDMSCFEAALNTKWSQHLTEFLSSTDGDTLSLCNSFFAESYYLTMKEVIESRSQFPRKHQKVQSSRAELIQESSNQRHTLVNAKVPPEAGNVSSQEVEGRKQLLRLVQPEELLVVEKHINDAWQKERDQASAVIKPFLPVQPSDDFWVTHYYEYLEELYGYRAKQGSVSTKNVKVQPDAGNVGPQEILRRQKLLQFVQEDDLVFIAKALEEKWQQERNQASALIQACLPLEATAEFWHAHYYNFMEEFFGTRIKDSNSSSSIAIGDLEDFFCPLEHVKVRPDIGNVSSEEVRRRKVLLQKLTMEQLEAVEKAMVDYWRTERCEASASLQASLPMEPTDEFWNAHYYTFIDRMYSPQENATAKTKSKSAHFSPGRSHRSSVEMGASSESTIKENAGQVSNQDGDAECVLGIGALLSVSSQPAAALVAASEYISSSQVMDQQKFPGLWRTEGYLLYHDDKPRSLSRHDSGTSPAKRKSGNDGENNSIAIDLLLADKLGPMMISLHDDSAKSFLTLLPKIKSTNSKAVLFIDNLKIADLPKNSWNGNVLTDMRTLQSVKGESLRTSVNITTTLASPFMAPHISFQVPAHGVCDDLLACQHLFVAPFRVSFHAIIVDVDVISHANNGGLKRHFTIVDRIGSYVRCCALSHNAASSSIVHGMDAVLFFGTGRCFLS